MSELTKPRQSCQPGLGVPGLLLAVLILHLFWEGVCSQRTLSRALLGLGKLLLRL